MQEKKREKSNSSSPTNLSRSIDMKEKTTKIMKENDQIIEKYKRNLHMTKTSSSFQK